MKHKILILSALILMSGQLVRAQQQQGMASTFTGIVSGKVLDRTDNSPLEYANVILYSLRDSSLVTGSITNEKGEFYIEKVPAGRYYAEIKFIGYNHLTTEPFSVNPRNPHAVMGDFHIETSSQNLEGVTVVGQKQMLTHNLDKRVFNVEKDINAEGGSALELMQNIPSVEVDMEGNVSLRGSQNVTILVNGRPSNYSSIEEIPSSIIETIEVVTNPSARYDPDGLSGIINIVLKKTSEPGYHGMVMLNAGTGDKYNGTLNFNYGIKRVNLFTNLSFRKQNMMGESFMDRQTTVDDGYNSLIQNQDFIRQGNFINLRTGVDITLNRRNTLSVIGGYGSRSFNVWDSTETSMQTALNPLPYEYYRQNNGINDGSHYNFTVNYKYDGPKKGQELTADIFYHGMNGNNGSNVLQGTILGSDILSREKTLSGQQNNALSFQTDLVQPVGNGGRIETGLKAVLRAQDANYQFFNYDDTGSWIDDLLRSNTFVYNEQLYSAYAIYSNTFGNEKFSYQGGLRAENWYTHGEQRALNYEPTNRSFFKLFPSAHIRWEMDSKNSVQAAYSRRVSRPHTNMLNPFIDYTDPLNLSMGNPELNPEFTHSYELSYYLNLPKTKLNTTLFQRNTTDIMTRYVEVDEDDVSWSTFKNIDSSQSLGIEGVISQTIMPWWKVNANATYYRTQLNSNFLDERSSVGSGWTTRATSVWNIGKNVELQVNGNYQSPTISVGGNMRFGQSGGGQGLTHERYWFDAGLRINVLNKKGTITFRVSDILKTMNYSSETWGTNFTSNINRYNESRIFFLGFTYRINEYKARRDRQASDVNMDLDMD